MKWFTRKQRPPLAQDTNSDLRPITPGTLIPSDFHAQLARGRHIATVAALRTDRNWMAVIILGMLLLMVFLTSGWHKADRRFAENVQVAYVKMTPDGQTTIDFHDSEKPVDFFRSTVEAKLSEYVERRFSRRRETISNDYGFASLFMSKTLGTDFITNYNAPKIAAEHLKCDQCEQVDVAVRNVQDLDKDIAPGSRVKHQYTTLLFAIARGTNRDGQITTCKNQIITLIWTFRPMEQIVNRREELKYNPLGMEIIRDSIRDDPSPLSVEACAKRSY
jgi:hypothetical protein